MLLCRYIRPRIFTHLQRSFRTMSVVNVKCVEGEDRLQISFSYAHNGGVERTFNAERLKTETLDVTLSRLCDSISKKVIRKKKKKTDNESVEDDRVNVSLLGSDGQTEIETNKTIEEALVHGNVLAVNGQKFTVNVNPPKCVKASITGSVMVNFPIFPELELEFAELSDCEFVWNKLKIPEGENNCGKASVETDTCDPSIERIHLSSDLSYTPTNSDIGYRLCFSITPKSENRTGDKVEVMSKFDVTAGPGFCPYENRQQYTQKVTDTGEFRAISYNILADLYASQDFSRDVLYNYCPPYALDFEYRKHLLLGELKGYNGDLICLQEVDKKFFQGGLSFAMDTLGLDGHFLEKGEKVREGSAVFYRRSKFRLLEERRELIKDILETNSACQDIVKKVYKVPALKDVLETRTTVLHILVLEPLDRPGQLLVAANTHLYFHPNAGHVRLIQMLTCMRYIDTVLAQYKKQKPCLLFCGDFNSTPARGIYEFMTTKQVKEDNVDWNDGGPEQYVPEMNFSHTHNIGSGCGLPAYTNYTLGFNGHLDYIYYDLDRLEVVQVIPMPDHRDVELHSGLPSITFPSDHIAQICDFKWK